MTRVPPRNKEGGLIPSPVDRDAVQVDPFLTIGVANNRDALGGPINGSNVAAHVGRSRASATLRSQWWSL